MKLTLRSCLFTETFLPGSQITLVEPLALKQKDNNTVDSFGHDEKFVVISCDGISCNIKSPRTFKVYTTTVRILDRAASVTTSQQKLKQVPSTLRGKRVY